MSIPSFLSNNIILKMENSETLDNLSVRTGLTATVDSVRLVRSQLLICSCVRLLSEEFFFISLP